MSLTQTFGSFAIASAVSLGLLATLPTDASLPNANDSLEAETVQLPQNTFLPTTSSNPRRLRLSLTLSNPEDLKVKQGDVVQAGQILSDRTQERQRLEAQKGQLQIQIQRLQQPIAAPPPVRPIPEVAGLPPASFFNEVAQAERQKLTVEQAERNLMQQQRMLDRLQSMPQSALPEATIPHEQEMLAQRQRELDQVRADLQLAEANLAQAQTQRQHQEYQHSLEMSKRAIAIQQAELQRQQQLQRQQEQEQERSFRLAQLELQIQNLDNQLFTLSAVRSPYSGTVQRIKFTGQSNQNLTVELVLTVDAAPTRSGSDLPPEPPSGSDAE